MNECWGSRSDASRALLNDDIVMVLQRRW